MLPGAQGMGIKGGETIMPYQRRAKNTALPQRNLLPDMYFFRLTDAYQCNIEANKVESNRGLV